MSRKYNRYMKVFRIVVVMCVLSFGIPFTLIQAQHAIAERGNMSLSNNYQTNSFLEIVIDKVEINERPRLEAIQLIANKANLRVTYDVEIPALMDRVSFELSNITVQDALWAVLDNSGVRYAISRNGQLALFPYEIQPAVQIIQNGSITGRVTDARNGDPLTGATIYIESISRGTLPDDDGYYKLEGIPAGEYTIVASFLGYRRITRDITIVAGEELVLNFELQPSSATLQEVEVVSTGYQDIPRERATGSFVSLNEEVINRRVSTNVLDRIEDISPGLIFNRSSATNDPITIRGRSTINANARPLIVVDNFPYDGDLENINPNDVATITVLKDAAAASIWGAQAGNGVIVITTKRAAFNSKPKFSFTSNTTIGEKPDLFYDPKMSINEFIDLEIAMFNAGRYNSRINSATRPVLTPTIEALLAVRNGVLTQSEADELINKYRQRDTRSEMERYFYRESVNQQYAMNISGGTETQRYIAAFGFDNNLPSRIGEETNRFTLSGNHSWKMLDEKLELTTGISFVRSYTTSDRDQFPSTSFSPYDVFKDENGNEVGLPWRYRLSYTETIDNPELLDWLYYPLSEMGTMDRSSRNNDFRVNTNLSYEIIPGMKASLLYQYWQSNVLGEHYRSVESFHTRDLVNRFAQVGPNGTTFPVPKNGILSWDTNNSLSHQGRFQINYLKSFGDRHEIVALAGSEVKHFETAGRSGIYYGYNKKYGTSVTVDHTTRFNLSYPSIFIPSIPTTGTNHTGFVDRFISYYANAAYTLDSKYTLTVSARKDASNLFGVRTNQKGVPLWSAGLSWIISNEDFYDVPLIPYLRTRLTYGYNGNIDKSVSAFLTANRQAAFGNSLPWFNGLEVSSIQNPENPDLRWERVSVFNVGVDYQLVNGYVSGSIDVYQKTGLDLIGVTPMAPQTGRTSFRGNFANTETKGMDLVVNATPLNSGFRWDISWLYTITNEKVTKYDVMSSNSQYVQASLQPLKGRPLHGIYSYEFGGLDPQTGELMGYLNGELSKNYNAIMQAYTPETLIYHGSGRPTRFGSIRNTAYWRGFNLSANVSFRFGYYFRRSTVNYTSLYNNFLFGHADYSRRWQNPGDEKFTDVPSAPVNFILPAGQQIFHNSNSSLVEKGDHIRLQDLRFGYNIPTKILQTLPIERGELFIYMNNLGLLWKSTSLSIDPDYPTSKPIRTISIGIKADF